MNTKINRTRSKKGLYAAIVGIILVALCCFAPILIATLAAVGFSAITPYLDYILYPALIILIIIAWLSYRKYKRASKSNSEK